MRPPRVAKRLPRIIEEDVIRKVLRQVAEEPRELALILLILDIGITLQELTDLDDRDVDLARGATRVFRQKTKKERLLFFSPATAAACAAYRAVRPPPVAEARFLLTWDGRPMTKLRIQKILERVGKRAGIGVRLSPHKLRHTFATMSLRNGSTLEHVKIMLGHSDVTTTSRNYTHLTDADVEKRARTSSPVANMGIGKGRPGRSLSNRGRAGPPEEMPEGQPGSGGGNTYVTIQNQAPQGTDSGHRLRQHNDALANVAKTVYDVRQFIAGYREDQRFIVTEHPNPPGFFTFQPLPHDQPESESFVSGSVALDYPAVTYFFQHLLELFPDLDLKDWRELVTSRTPLPKRITDRIRSLGNTARFTYCSSCQFCKDLNT